MEVFDGKNTVKTPVSIKIDNVNELSASVDLSDEKVHEGGAINSSIGSVKVSGDSNLTYSLSGEFSDDFNISSNGEIRINKSLNYSSKNSYELTLNIQGQEDSISVPLNIELVQNQDPNFITSCENSCALPEGTSSGTIIINSSRTDTDSDNLSYSLENDFANKFTIDPKTGQVRLNGFWIMNLQVPIT